MRKVRTVEIEEFICNHCDAKLDPLNMIGAPHSKYHFCDADCLDFFIDGDDDEKELIIEHS